ncbi:MAG: SIMPL domain-containing protein [Cyclobacteriaceae bacterium]|nr:MAG: SIMPL domain-containing protein [Cyclobacteriaceae bacterium]
MKQLLTIILATTIHSLVFGQETKTQEIEVLGVGKLTTKADYAKMIISLTADSDDRSEVVRKLNSDSETIRKDLLAYGFKQDQITVTDFNINDNNSYRRPPKGRKRFEGYRGVLVKYNFDYEFNAKVTEHLATHPLRPYFKFEFELSESKKEIIRKELMEKAIIDAKTKAEIIANSSNVKLKRIIKIRYGEQSFTPNVEVNTVDLVTSMVRPTLAQVIDSPSIDYGETIVVTWEFE